MARTYVVAERGGGDRIKGNCHKCGKKMLQKNIQRHFNRHHRRERPQYRCEKCIGSNQTYSNESNYIAHYRKVHLKHLPAKKKSLDKIPIPEPQWVPNENYKKPGPKCQTNGQKQSKAIPKKSKNKPAKPSKTVFQPQFEFVSVDEQQ